MLLSLVLAWTLGVDEIRFAAAPAAVTAAFKKLRRVPSTTMTGRLLPCSANVNDGRARARLDSDAALRQYRRRDLGNHGERSR